jgi:hypothetical protein
MNVKNVRLINKEESDEINRLSNEALKLLNLSDESNIIDILNKMNIFVDNFIENNSDNSLEEDYAYKFGSLFGNLINAKYEWHMVLY